jgi:hypothetical protein
MQKQSALNVRADVLDVAQEAQDATIWPCLVCYFSSFPLSLHHIKYIKRHMFGILNVDEIKN